MKIKVCGMRDADNIREVAALNPDYMGFIFYAPSPRCCSRIAPESITGLPESIQPVMVTVDMAESDILRLADKYGFRNLQLHGKESPELCRSLRQRGFNIIKAFGLSSTDDLDTIEKYNGTADVFLFDTASAAKGGTGKKFDWKILDSYAMDVDFWLSGGIGPDDTEILKKIEHPRFAGIDLNSRFEISPAYKDSHLLKTFLESLND